MRHSIVLVPFPFDDFTNVKVRPAVCLTNKIGGYEHIVIAFITSQVSKNKSASDIEIESSDETGLKVKSLIRLHRLLTIPAQLIRRRLGQLPKSKERELKGKLKQLFDL